MWTSISSSYWFLKNGSTSIPTGTIFSQELSSISWDKRRKRWRHRYIIINAVKEEIDIEILPNDLDRSHRIGNSKTKKREIPIIVKLVRYNLIHNIFKNKKSLKGKGVSITKSLTKDRMAKLNKGRETCFRNVWTSDGKIF